MTVDALDQLQRPEIEEMRMNTCKTQIENNKTEQIRVCIHCESRLVKKALRMIFLHYKAMYMYSSHALEVIWSSSLQVRIGL
jgi:hypothetical protein